MYYRADCVCVLTVDSCAFYHTVHYVKHFSQQGLVLNCFITKVDLI